MKMEKADILEMTVAYLRTVYRCSAPPTVADSATSDDDVTTMTSSDDVTSGGRYAAGYRQCVLEVAQHLGDVASTGCAAGGGGVHVDVVRTKLLRHLTAILHGRLLPHPADDHDDSTTEQLRAATTPFPEVESRSCVRTASSPASSEPEADSSEAIPASPRVLDAVDHTGLQGVPSTASSRSWSSLDRSMLASPPTDRDQLTNATSPACIHLLTTDAAGVWRPW